MVMLWLDSPRRYRPVLPRKLFFVLGLALSLLAQQQPHFFNDITIRVGDVIDVSDLIAKHEDEHGPLWKYSEAKARGGADEVGSGPEGVFGYRVPR